MKVRNIDIDFSAARIHWTPRDPEFALFWNATSTFLPYLEPFLNKAVRAGMEMLPPDQQKLRQDCKIFIAQEGRHYKNHAKFNQVFRASGYPELPAREAVMAADYERFWQTKGHKYCLGYAEGFETLGPILACFFLEGARELQSPDVDDPTADLWRWHLAEEYEHRCVCNYLYHGLYGGYWYRIYGIGYAGSHMLSYMVRTALYAIREDRKNGRIKGVWRSRFRTFCMFIRMFAYLIPRVLRALNPKYDPAKIPPPRRSMEVLDQAEAKWGRAQPQG